LRKEKVSKKKLQSGHREKAEKYDVENGIRICICKCGENVGK
jgi:hypothetical protein